MKNEKIYCELKKIKTFIEIKIHLRIQGRMDTAENNENREKCKVK